MIFQDPYASLNPRKRVGSIIDTPLKIHGVDKLKRRARVQELLEDGRPLAGALQPLSPRVLRRPAPADRGRPGPRPEAEADRCGRAGLGARRLDPVPDAESPGRPPDRAPAHLPLHRPRSRGRPPRERPDRRDVPGEARRALAGRGSPPAPDHALHRGASLGRPDPGSRSERPAGADHPRRRRPEPDRPALGLPLPSHGAGT